MTVVFTIFIVKPDNKELLNNGVHSIDFRFRIADYISLVYTDVLESLGFVHVYFELKETKLSK